MPWDLRGKKFRIEYVTAVAANLIFAPDVVADLSDAYDWYETQRIGLGDDFLQRIDACVQGVLRQPEMYGIIHKGYRRALVRRFPYAIFYEYENNTVTVYGVFHTSVDPEKWRRRLS
jgi:plasmid stabilization system protein ParE